jgi:hypothetical protein
MTFVTVVDISGDYEISLFKPLTIVQASFFINSLVNYLQTKIIPYEMVHQN